MKKFLLALTLAILSLTPSLYGQVYNYGTGSAASNTAPFASGNASVTVVSNSATVTASTTIAGGTYNFVNFTVNPSVILTVTGTAPLIIRCTGTATINGTITAAGGNGGNGAASVAGAGGTGVGSGAAGGAGSAVNSTCGLGGAGSSGSSFGGSTGRGVGGAAGSVGSSIAGGGGGGASYGTTGGVGGAGSAAAGTIYNNASLSTNVTGSTLSSTVYLCGGSGGGGGGSVAGCGGGRYAGGGGGAGGGAIQITANAMVFGASGLVSTKGGNGGTGNFGLSGYAGSGGGAGGSGGTISLQYFTISGFTAGTNSNILGGTGGTSAGTPAGGTGGAGGQGRLLAQQDVVLCTQPTTSPGTLTYSNIVSNGANSSVDITLTRANPAGTGGLIIVGRAAAAPVDPSSSTAYNSPSTVFSSPGSTTAAGSVVVYNSNAVSAGGTATFTVTGLAASTTYNFTAYEWNSTLTCYRVPGVNSTIAIPACTPPNTAASGLNTSAPVSNGSSSTCNINFTRGNGTTGYLVVAKAGSAPTDPTNNSSYLGNSNFATAAGLGASYTTGGSSYVLYNSNTPASGAVSLSVTGLTNNTTYYFKVYEFTGTCYNAVSSTVTAAIPICDPPAPQANGFGLGASTTSTQVLNWSNNGNADGSIVVVSQGSAPTDPTMLTNYSNPQADITAGGSTTAAGSFVVYRGNATSVTVAGLLTNTTYFYKIYTYNATTNCYNLTSPISGSFTSANGPMAYISSTAVQQTGSVLPGSVNQALLQVQIVTNTGTAPALTLNALTFNTNGTTAVGNLNAARIYYTGNSATFATTTQYGSDVTTFPGGSNPIVVNGSQTLANGTNYFWIAYDVAISSPTGNLLDAECTSINTGSANAPTVTAPSGNRTIVSLSSPSCAYTYTSFSPTYTSIVGLSGTVVAGSGTLLDDNQYTNITMPNSMTFEYNGKVYSSFGINANGFIWFGTYNPVTGNVYTPISTTLGYEATIAAMGGDLQAHSAASATPQISYRVAGTAPNRTLTVQWTAFMQWGNTGGGCNGLYTDWNRLDFQIVLYENDLTGTSPNRIEMVYPSQGPYCINGNGGNFQIGLRGSTNADYLNRSQASGNWTTSSTAAGGANNATCVFGGSNYINGLLGFRFTPTFQKPTVSPTPTASNICPAITVALTGSSGGTTRQWYRNNVAISGATTTTTTASLSGSFLYTVSSSGCTKTADVVTVTINACNPTAYTVTGGTNCGSTTVGVSNFESGVSYQLKLNGTDVGSPITTGTVGSPISFGAQTTVGTYTVVGTNGSGSTTMSGSAIVNATPATPTITPSASTTICTGGSINLTSSYATGNVWSTSATSQAISVNTAGSFTVTYTDANNCSSTSATTTTTVVSCGPIQWTGTTNHDWNTGTNWSTGNVPTVSDDIIIPDVANDPILSTNHSVRDLDIASGAFITINSGKTLDVKRDWTSVGNYIAGPGKLILSGTAPQVIDGGATISNLVINNTNGVAVTNGTVNVTTALVMTAGTLTTNGNITLVSTAAKTAYIDDFTTGSSVSIVGNVTVQRYIPAGVNGFRYIGAPVNNGSSFSVANFNGTFTTQGIAGQVIPQTPCSSTNTASNSPYGNFMYWNEAGPFTANTACYQQEAWYFQTGGNMVKGKGYGAKLFPGSTISYTGSPNTGSVSLGTLVNSAGPSDGWQLVANPYPSPIKISNTDGNANNNMPSGFDPQVKFFIPNSAYQGTYQTYSTTIPSFNPPTIAVGQGFWIHVTTGNSGAWSLTNNYRTADSTASYYDNNAASLLSHLKVDVTGNGFMDKTDIAFVDQTLNAAEGKDINDGNKWESKAGQPTVYTTIGDEMIAINAQPKLENTKLIPMGFKPGTNGDFSFTFGEIATFPASAMISLEDLQLGTMTDLRANNTYNFTSSTTDSPDRFVIHFTPGVTAAVTDQDCDHTGAIEFTQPGTTVWAAYDVKDNNGQVYAQGVDYTGTLNVTNLTPQEYILTLTHASGYVAQEFITVNGINPINAALAASATDVQVDDVVTFTATSTNATEYVWSFGDGNTLVSTVNTASHAYENSGSYTVLLTASNDDCNGVATKTINVNNTATDLTNTKAEDLKIYGYGTHLVVEFNNWSGAKADIVMYNAIGQRVETFTGLSTLKGRQELNVADIKPGVYFVQAISNGKTIAKKVFLGSN